MENTITISVQDDFLENRAHGDTAFPCAAYFTDAKTHDIRWHWHEEYEVSIVRSGSCPLSVGTDHLVLHAGDGIFINTGTLHSQETTKATSDFYKEDLVFHGRLIYGSKYTVFWQKYMKSVKNCPACSWFSPKTVRNWNLTIGRIAPRRCST